MKLKWTVLYLLMLPAFLAGQNRHWVFFTGKPDTLFDPYAYFDHAGLERRTARGLPLYDNADLPVSEEYLAAVSKMAGKPQSVSRWMNAAVFVTGRRQIRKIQQLPFVSHTRPAAPFGFVRQNTRIRQTEPKKESLSGKQLELMGGRHFEPLCVDGKGVRIAVFDGGFPGVREHPAFIHLINDHRIIASYDFVRKRENVYKKMTHGTMVLSCLAGKIGDRKLGLATGAEYLLAITERSGEPFSEEENWLEAMEWAHRNGADIISSSLGYNYHRYFRHQMDGQTSLVARAARIAARKGILVVNAMGNEGDKKWEILGTPADVDSVLSVGGVDPFTAFHISFSSFGPAAGGAPKPNVCANGIVLVAGKTGLKTAQGTSFSTPLVAGFAACVKQMHPGINNMELMHEIEKSAHLYPYHDLAHGYGIPQASYFTGGPVKKEPSFRIVHPENMRVIEVFQINSDPDVIIPAYLYYHIARADGTLRKYAVIDVYDHEPLTIPDEMLEPGEQLRIHFRGYTETVLID